MNYGRKPKTSGGPIAGGQPKLSVAPASNPPKVGSITGGNAEVGGKSSMSKASSATKPKSRKKMY